MTPFTLHQGNCIDVMRGMPDQCIDAVITDPPYHLTNNSGAPTSNSPYSRARAGGTSTGFMGQEWDGGDIAQRVELWIECLRLLKPGGHLLAFGGTRTQHRMICAIEDAGFEIRDQIGWMYATGFPKSRNIAEYGMQGEDAEKWKGWGTAMKPAWEPICVARKPVIGTVTSNVLKFGTGALNIDACRVQSEFPEHSGTQHNNVARNGETSRNRRYAKTGATNFAATPGVRGGDPSGRWPANLIHDGSATVIQLFPNNTGQRSVLKTRNADSEQRNTYGKFSGTKTSVSPHDSPGNAARFFYCAKASWSDRNQGVLTERKSRSTDTEAANTHPTVKPTELMAYLCRLVTPPKGLILDPFMGSGSTGKAAIREGFQFTGIDLSSEYIEIARSRIADELAKTRSLAEAELMSRQMDLFGSNQIG